MYPVRNYLAPAAVLVSLIGLMLWLLMMLSDSDVSDVTGTVCCISEKYGVGGVKHMATPIRMMTIELDDGRRVDTEIGDVPYVSGKRILLKETKNSETGLHFFRAVRYLD
tara:strand:- start:1219 stop:1548 length:330 start_codon:yes stop_codon:yes gene_type:complete